VREADAIRRLQHPNIVRIRDAGVAPDGRLYIAMERLVGETLRARLAGERGGPLAPRVAIEIALQIAGALSLAHAHGTFHRDIKPDNIFLLPDGTAKLMDFGAARIDGEQSLTQTGNVIGSPAYMAPEQVVGEPADARTDVWGLAATLFEMVAGQKPFPGDAVAAVMYAILHRRPNFAPVPSPALAAVLERALAKRAAARYATMGEFAGALRQAASAAPDVTADATHGAVAALTGPDAGARGVLPRRAIGRHRRGASRARTMVVAGAFGAALAATLTIAAGWLSLRSAHRKPPGDTIATASPAKPLLPPPRATPPAAASASDTAVPAAAARPTRLVPDRRQPPYRAWLRPARHGRPERGRLDEQRGGSALA
jgi:serine/threonine-protein kinase